MHRRARHLNAKDAGAVLVLDSRFITGLANNDPVSTWVDRSGSANDATASDTARPLYKTTTLNGQPVLNFDGGDDKMQCSNSCFSGSQSRFIICIYNSISTGSFIDPIAGQSRLTLGTSVAGSWFVVQSRTAFAIGDPYIAGYSADTVNNKTTPDNQWKIASGLWDGVNLETVKNSVVVDTVPRSLSTYNSPFRIGWDQDSTIQSLQGNIAMVLSGPIFLPAPLRRRLEHSAAFAFKIPCN